MAVAAETNSEGVQHIVVASKNPVKLNAVLQGFQRMFSSQKFTISGVAVSSGVPDQPMSDQETFRGARNRALHASHEVREADFWVGLEGGVDVDLEGEMQSFAWIVVKGKDRSGRARTATYYQPVETKELVKQGIELGHADDIVFGRENSKQANGSSGLLTGDAVNRTELYEQAVVLALIPFKNPALTFRT